MVGRKADLMVGQMVLLKVVNSDVMTVVYLVAHSAAYLAVNSVY